MKDQYFGDARDYLKYHLLQELMTNVPRLKQLVCLWMLTRPDKTNEGNVPFAESAELPELTAFLRRHLESGDRRVSHVREYFRDRNIEYVPWGDEPPYFSGGRRKQYFEGIPAAALQGSLVFLDPDIGLTAGKPTEKHLAFAELAAIYDRMDTDCLAVVYQHFQRKPNFWDNRAADLRNWIDAAVGYVADPSVGVFVLLKSARQLESVNRSLDRVAAIRLSRKVGRVTAVGK